MKNSRQFYLLISLCLLPLSIQAESLSVHGFLAQGLAQAKKSNAVNNSGDLSAALTEVGINANWKVSSRLKLSGQLVYLNGGNRYPEGGRLDYLFLDISLLDDFDHQLNLYLGRYKNQHWLYSSTRDVPFTRPSIMLPQSIYYDAFRDIAVASDGVAIKGYLQGSSGELEYNWSLGATNITKAQSQILLSPVVQGEAKQKFVHQASLFWQSLGSQATYGISLLDSDFSYGAADFDFFFDADLTVQRFMLTWRYQAEKWELAAELMQERLSIKGFYQPGFRRDQKGQGGYLLGRYQLSTKLSALITLDYLTQNKNDKRGSSLPEIGIPAYFGYQQSIMFGLSYAFAKNWQWQVEHHWVDGTGRLSPSLIPDLALNNQRYWQVWALQLTYRF
ncbi:hypothetical protein GCM10010919_31940 [Alishewanella longhuensis]|uniref:Phosphate-selective porin O and P n=1 Tax=Alishewanella longhuensis TaxID=1091037 RepID=A0ABQ3L270_9ALTE|nr:hypothetical protein [Alishewanella longhuensis]GHG76800.1 hypothetical protein GCM10010919_31940 [Alishewanella longhuensis]